MSAGLLFQLLGEDVSATGTLEALEGKGKTVAASIATAFAGMAIGEAFSNSLEEGKIDATFEAAIGQTPEIAEESAEKAGDAYRSGWGTSLSDMTTAIQAVGQQMTGFGEDAQDDLEGLAESTYAVATSLNSNVTDVARAAGEMMKTGLAEDGKSALDLLAAGETEGANRGGDLLATLQNYSPTFQALGIDGQDALGIINDGLAAGAPNADTAVKGLNYFYNVVSSDGPTAAKAFALIGLNADDMSAKLAAGGPSAEEATSTIIEALQGMTDPVAQQQAGVDLFGKSWKKAGDETITALDPAKASITDVSGAAEQMGDTMQDTADTKVEAMRRTFEYLEMQAVQLPGPLGEVSTVIAALGSQGFEMVSALVLGINAMRDLGVGTKIATAAMWIFDTAMDANPIMLVVIAIAAVVAVIIYLWNTSEGFRDAVIGLWDDIVGAFEWLGSEIASIWDDVIGGIESAFSGVVDFIEGICDAIWNAFSYAWNGVISGAEWVANWIENIFDTAVSWVQNIIGWFGDIFSGIGSGIADFIKQPINWIISCINWIIDRLDDIRFTVPDWVPGIGGDWFGIDIGEIPYLAEGGVVDKPTVAMIGEAGPEAVVPLGKLGGLGGSGGPSVTINPKGFVFGTPAQVANQLWTLMRQQQRAGALPASLGLG